ncbi:MAG: hypothetical protein IIV90_07130 [Oscillospiraceae bacterium]|nr:hypothetical protein [Oscillospiraceae bacterium]
MAAQRQKKMKNTGKNGLQKVESRFTNKEERDTIKPEEPVCRPEKRKWDEENEKDPLCLGGMPGKPLDVFVQHGALQQYAYSVSALY